MSRLGPVLCVSMLAALTACASHYAPGKSSANIPASVSAVKLDKVGVVSGLIAYNIDNPEAVVDNIPSEEQVKVGGILKTAILSKFRESGIQVVEGEGQTHEIRMRLYYRYHRVPGFNSFDVRALLYVDANDGDPIFHEESRFLTENVIQLFLKNPDDEAKKVGEAVALSTVRTVKGLKK
jgi:hypothetical protein